MKKMKLQAMTQSDQAKAVELKKKQERERKFMYRQRQKAKVNAPVPETPSSSAYGNTASFGKAVQRAKRNLPKSPSKITAVIRRLALNESSKICVKWQNPKKKN